MNIHKPRKYDWSICRMGRVVDDLKKALEKALEKALDHPSLILNKQFMMSVFKEMTKK